MSLEISEPYAHPPTGAPPAAAGIMTLKCLEISEPYAHPPTFTTQGLRPAAEGKSG